VPWLNVGPFRRVARLAFSVQCELAAGIGDGRGFTAVEYAVAVGVDEDRCLLVVAGLQRRDARGAARHETAGGHDAAEGLAGVARRWGGSGRGRRGKREKAVASVASSAASCQHASCNRR
jgi:hypothetical protein